MIARFSIPLLVVLFLKSCAVPYRVDQIHSISEPNAYILEKDHLWGVISSKGEWLIQPDSTRIIDYHYPIIKYAYQEQYFLKNLQTQNMSDTFSFLAYDIMHDCYYAEKNDQHGYLNGEGEVLIPLIYERTHSIPERPEDGFIRVRKEGLYGVIDLSGKELIPINYYFIEYKGDSLFACRPKKESPSSLVNHKNEEVLPVQYSFSAFPFSEKKILAFDHSLGAWGAVDTHGQVVVDFDYDYGGVFHHGLLPVRKNEKWGLVNDQNEEVVHPHYSSISKGKQGLFSCSLHQKYGLIDSRGKERIPLRYDHLDVLNDRFVKVSKNGKYGVLDTDGATIIPIEFDAIAYNENTFHLVLGDSSRYLNEEGVPIHKQFYSHHYRDNMREGYALVKHNDRYGLMNQGGKVFVPCKYEAYTAISSNPRMFVLYRKGKYFEVSLEKGKQRLHIPEMIKN